MALPQTIRVVRPDDQVVLDVTPTGFTPVPGPGGPMLKAGDGSVLRIRLQPQHLVEYANPVQPKGNVLPVHHVDQRRHIFTHPAELVVAVPADFPPFPLTVAGLLETMRALPLVTDQANGTVNAAAITQAVSESTAAPPPRNRAGANALSLGPVDRATLLPDPGRPARPGAKVTAAVQTRIPAPYRLVIRPPGGTGVEHPTLPVTKEDRTELWRSRLVVRHQPGTPPVETTLPVVFDHVDFKPSAGSLLDEKSILNALTAEKCSTIAAQSLPGGSARVPADLRRLSLSSLGAWFELSGSWPGVPVFEHSAAMGRDQRQHVSVTGVLYPFGHPATLTSTSARSFETKVTRGAALFTESVVSVRQRRMEFRLEEHRDLPWDHVDIVDATSPVGEERKPDGLPSSLGGVVFLSVNGKPHAFRCEALDRTGAVTSFAMPMLFVPDDKNTPANRPALERVFDELRFGDTDLGGQELGIVPDVGDAQQGLAARTRSTGRAAAVTSGQPPATTILAHGVSLARREGRAVVKQFTGHLPALDKFAPSLPDNQATRLVMSYAQPYLKAGFGTAKEIVDGEIREIVNSQAQLFLTLAKEQAVGLAKEATGGLAQLGIPVSAISREAGGVAAKLGDKGEILQESFEKLASGDVDLSFLLSSGSTLLGLLPLHDLIGDVPVKLGKGQKMTSDVKDGVVTTTFVWDVPLLEKKKRVDLSLTSITPFVDPKKDPTKPDAKPNLHIEQTTTLDTQTGEVHSVTSCKATMLQLELYPTTEGHDSDSALVTIPFRSISFTTKDAQKPDVDVDLGKLRFGGLLAFVATLAELVDQQGFTDPPAITVTERGVKSSFSFALPSVPVGMFLLENIAFSASLDLNFDGQPALLLTTGFASPKDPFRVTVAALGGGGYLMIAVSTAGLEAVVGSLEFGASLAVDLVVAKARVEAMGGVTFTYTKKDGVVITAFLRIHGELDVLGIIRVAVTLTLTMTYVHAEGVLRGRAELVVEISLLFFAKTVTVTFERTFAGASASPAASQGASLAGGARAALPPSSVLAPTFADLMAPGGTTTPWDEYCLAFAPPVRP